MGKINLKDGVNVMNYIIEESYQGHEDFKELMKSKKVTAETLKNYIIQIKQRDQMYKALLHKIYMTAFSAKPKKKIKS